MFNVGGHVFILSKYIFLIKGQFFLLLVCLFVCLYACMLVHSVDCHCSLRCFLNLKYQKKTFQRDFEITFRETFHGGVYFTVNVCIVVSDFIWFRNIPRFFCIALNVKKCKYFFPTCFFALLFAFVGLRCYLQWRK